MVPDSARVDDSRSKLSFKRPSNTPTPHGSGHFCLVYAATTNSALLICLQPSGLQLCRPLPTTELWTGYGVVNFARQSFIA